MGKKRKKGMPFPVQQRSKFDPARRLELPPVQKQPLEIGHDVWYYDGFEVQRFGFDEAEKRRLEAAKRARQKAIEMAMKYGPQFDHNKFIEMFMGDFGFDDKPGRDLPPVGGKDPSKSVMRCEAEFIDEFEEDQECQLKVRGPMNGDQYTVILINIRDMEDLYDGTYLISERALQAYGLL